MKKRPPKVQYNPRPIDASMREAFYDALLQTAEVPAEARWSLLVDLLPEKFFYYVLVASQQEEMALMDRLGPLAMLLTEVYFEEEANANLLMTALYGLVMVAVAELERKELQFCESVDIIEEPFLITLPDYSPLHPKDPENFDLKELVLHHISRYEGSDL